LRSALRGTLGRAQISSIPWPNLRNRRVSAKWHVVQRAAALPFPARPWSLSKRGRVSPPPGQPPMQSAPSFKLRPPSPVAVLVDAQAPRREMGIAPPSSPRSTKQGTESGIGGARRRGTGSPVPPRSLAALKAESLSFSRAGKAQVARLLGTDDRRMTELARRRRRGAGADPRAPTLHFPFLFLPLPSLLFCFLSPLPIGDFSCALTHGTSKLS